jgi:hypothetical protein
LTENGPAYIAALDLIAARYGIRHIQISGLKPASEQYCHQLHAL